MFAKKSTIKEIFTEFNSKQKSLDAVKLSTKYSMQESKKIQELENSSFSFDNKARRLSKK